MIGATATTGTSPGSTARERQHANAHAHVTDGGMR